MRFLIENRWCLLIFKTILILPPVSFLFAIIFLGFPPQPVRSNSLHFLFYIDARGDLVGLLEAVSSWPLAISYNQELFCQQPMAISQ
jgi:hypothetical protein